MAKIDQAVRSEKDVMAMRPKHRFVSIVVALAKGKPLGTFGAALICLMVLVAIFAPVLSTHDPERQDHRSRLLPPGQNHWFGTDGFGRDVYSGVVWGSRLSLWVGLLAVSIGTLTGTFLGLISGYFGDKADFTIQRLIDLLMSFPTLILAMAAVMALGNGVNNVMLAVAITFVPSVTRVVRGSVLSVKENQYVEASRAIGSTNVRIVTRHIFPNVLAPIIVIATLQLGNAILIEASLSFLGLGAPPTTPSWGKMLGFQNLRYMEYAPWSMLAPGVALGLTVLAVNLLGDAVRDVLDPRLRGTGRLR